MTFRHAVALTTGSLFCAALLAACGPGGTGGPCVGLHATPADLTCTTNQDCKLVVTGTICPGYIPSGVCAASAANGAGAARLEADLAAIPKGESPGDPPEICDAAAGTPSCVQGQCTVCFGGTCSNQDS